MKLKLHHILVTTCLSILAPAVTSMLYAQDASFDETPAASEKERVNYYPGGEGEPSGGSTVTNSNTSKSSVVARDSSAFKAYAPGRGPAEPSKHNAKPSHDEDDVLSFNFLYYIIRKYKLQDIVD